MSFSSPAAATSPRGNVYYWKCDRPAAFHGVLRKPDAKKDAALVEQLRVFLQEAFPGPLQLAPASGEGTHRTYLLRHEQQTYFVRVEDGPEGDTHLAMETEVMAVAARTGTPVPRVFFCDAGRRRVPFSVQVIEFYDSPNLNRAYLEGGFPIGSIAEEIGRSVAGWQAAPVRRFGPFERIDPDGIPSGFHASYATYFHLHLDRHLHQLQADGFLSASEAANISRVIEDHAVLLELEHGCLVHKDLALWNMIGTSKGITAFIDWDDAISGDPTDDLSLLACFHSSDFLQAALRGYESVRPLPQQFIARFWLHLLRNMIVKAVIRSGAGYFSQTKGNFLLAAGQDGAALRDITRQKLLTAYQGLLHHRPLSDL